MVAWRFRSERCKAPSRLSSKPKSDKRKLTRPEPQNAKRTNDKTTLNHKHDAPRTDQIRMLRWSQARLSTCHIIAWFRRLTSLRLWPVHHNISVNVLVFQPRSRPSRLFSTALNLAPAWTCRKLTALAVQFQALDCQRQQWQVASSYRDAVFFLDLGAFGEHTNTLFCNPRVTSGVICHRPFRAKAATSTKTGQGDKAVLEELQPGHPATGG